MPPWRSWAAPSRRGRQPPPAVPGRWLIFLRELLPLPVLELSHLLGSVAGLWLLLLARGLYRRLDGAYWLACCLYLAGIVFSLLKGGDWGEALLLAILLGGLAPAHRAFYRKASLIEQRFTPAWAAAVATVVCGSLWLASFAFKHHGYSRDMWWHFAFASDAPRALRASVLVAALAGAYMLSRLLAPAQARPRPPDADQLAAARTIAFASPSAEAQIALMGDKCFLFNRDRMAFLMYAVAGRSWVALGDPVGPEAAWPPLHLAIPRDGRRGSGWPVSTRSARRLCPSTSTSGSPSSNWARKPRFRWRRFPCRGRRAASCATPISGHKRTDPVSRWCLPMACRPCCPKCGRFPTNGWPTAIRAKGILAGQLRFRLSRKFSDRGGAPGRAICAFANLWLAGDKEEIAIDLMRHRQDSGYGVMDYLFIETMLWGQAKAMAGSASVSRRCRGCRTTLWRRCESPRRLPLSPRRGSLQFSGAAALQGEIPAQFGNRASWPHRAAWSCHASPPMWRR